MGRPSKNPLRPAPGSIALISPQRYFKLSGINFQAASPPEMDRKTWVKFLRGEEPVRRNKVEQFATRLSKSDLSMTRELGDKLRKWTATDDSYVALHAKRLAGNEALEAQLEAADWRTFREAFSLPNAEDTGRNADFFASHLLPMQETSFMATRLAAVGKYAEALETLETSPIGAYVEWQPLRDALPTVKNAGDFSNRLANVRLLSVLFVLAVMEHEYPFDGSRSKLADIVPTMNPEGLIEPPMAKWLNAVAWLRARATQENAPRFFAARPTEGDDKLRDRWRRPVKPGEPIPIPELRTLVNLCGEIATLTSQRVPSNKLLAQAIRPDIACLSRLTEQVVGAGLATNAEDFNGFFGMYRTMYDDMGRGDSHGGSPLPSQL